MNLRLRKDNKLLPTTGFDIEEFIRTNLKELFGLDERQGKAINDLMIKPLKILMEPFIRELDYIRKSQSIVNYEELEDSDIDALLANIFVERDAGSLASTIIRFTFPEAQDFTVPVNTRFVSGQLGFVTLIPFSITKIEMLTNQTEDGYFFDVIAYSEEPGSKYNVKANEINIVELLSLPAGVSLTNPFDVTNGRDKESNKRGLGKRES